jgi:3-hydroxyacyl-[acyl-carrier-protein] dehydratase
MEAILFNPDPRFYLPHRPPFLFIDTIVELQPGVGATGELTVTDAGYFPPLLLVEAMAQIGGIAAGQQGGEGGVLAAVGRVELPVAVALKIKLIICARIIKIFGPLIKVEADVRENGKVIASADLTLAVVTSASQVNLQ